MTKRRKEDDMKENGRMQRRRFLRTVALGGAAATATLTSIIPRKAFSQSKEEWRMINMWSQKPNANMKLFSKMVSEGTEGLITIKFYGPGKIVPFPKTIEAVADGTVEMGTGSPNFWTKKVPAMAYLQNIPFGLTAQEQNAWFEFGGGQELADKIYAEVGCKFFPFGNTGFQMGGWFNKEINSIGDFKGLKIRIGGLGGATLKAAGAEVVSLPLRKVPPALKDGQIDAAEFIGPFHDMYFGFHKIAKYYYYPAWHEPSGAFDLFINKAKWDAQPSKVRAVITAAAAAINSRILCNRVALNSAALAKLTGEHGVQLRQFPDELLKELAPLSEKVLRERASKDKLSEEILNSIIEFRKSAASWTAISLQPYLAARSAIL
jgi:TRAP-type mannitol/chloroaromatic compound transport system substrate-binding protein